MIRDITIGQYYPCDSLIHRLDSRTKIISTLLFVAELFIVDSFIGFAVITAAMFIVIAISKVPTSFRFRGLKMVFMIIMFTFVINVLLTDGRIIWQWHFIRITYEGIYRAFYMTVRLVLLIIGSSLLTLCTKPMELTDGLEKLLRPLEKINISGHEIALMITIALRFIPTLLEETDKIMKAQQARGADFESGNIVQRAKSLVPILIPLFISSFRIAQDLALAMESRCYHGGKGRTRMNEIKFSGIDIIAAVVELLFLAIVIVLRIMF